MPAVQAMIEPTMITQAPMNMDQRRPSLSEMTAAKGDATIVPLEGISAIRGVER